VLFLDHNLKLLRKTTFIRILNNETTLQEYQARLKTPFKFTLSLGKNISSRKVLYSSLMWEKNKHVMVFQQKLVVETLKEWHESVT
jgi:hypothetical protein